LGDKIVEDKERYDIDEVRNWLSEFRGGAEHREMMDLAVMVREIAGRGEAERQMCREMLEAVMRYTDQRNEGSFLGTE
jgi:hypothetical protein